MYVSDAKKKFKKLRNEPKLIDYTLKNESEKFCGLIFVMLLLFFSLEWLKNSFIRRIVEKIER